MVTNLLLWQFQLDSRVRMNKCGSEKSNDFSASNYTAIIAMKNDRKKLKENLMFWFLAQHERKRRKTRFIVVMLLLSTAGHVFAPIIPHNLNFANKQLLKSFLCSLRFGHKKPITIAGTSNEIRRFMQKLWNFFRLHKLCIHALIQ